MRVFQVPNFCRNTSILLVLLITQVVVTALWLLASSWSTFETLFLYSFFTQIAVLSICLVLCLSRRWVGRQSYWVGFGVCWAVVVVVAGGVNLLSQFIQLNVARPEIVFGDFVRVVLAASLIFLLLVRFFALLTTLDTRSKSEVESRMLALQSRIQPHFLFNSLNTIAELTSVSPKDAESAIHGLSLLFRASLENQKTNHSLKSELMLCKRYIELERWRLGENLKINWNVDVKSRSRWWIPKLVLQPIIENSVKYGANEDGMIEIDIDIKETKSDISIMVTNPVSQTNTASPGHGIALENIKERLHVLYDDAYRFSTKATSDRYSVILRVPKRKVS